MNYHNSNIEIKPKKCKGTGIAKGFGCGEFVIERKYGLGYKCRCYNKFLTETEAGRSIIKKLSLKVTEPRRSLLKAQSERQLPKALHTTRQAVHSFVRFRDKGKPCISCDKPWHNEFQAGHFFKSELYSSVRFDVDNIHGQCVYCNMQLEGNLLEYEKRLSKRIGEERFTALKLRAIKNKGRATKWNLENLKQIREQIAVVKKLLKNRK